MGERGGTTERMATRLGHRRDRRRRAGRRDPGMAPDVLSPAPDAHPTVLGAVLYDEERLEESSPETAEAIPDPAGATLWVDVVGLGDEAAMRALGERFGLHPLTLSDIVHTHQRPKTELYDDYLVVILRLPSGGAPFESEQMTFVIGRSFLLTFQERPGDCFDPVRERLRQGARRMRRGGPSYLAYALIDALIDSYFPILERYGDVTERLEEQVILSPEPRLIAEIHLLKRELLDLRRALWPQREAINAMLRDETPVLTAEARTFLRDCADHSFQLLDMVEVYREVAQGLVDLHLSSVSNRMNEVMKVLTVIATVFIPMTFIAGVYGMNFDRTSPWNMPELGWRFGYLFALGLMLAFAGSMLLVFWRRGWILSGGGSRRSAGGEGRNAEAGPDRRPGDGSRLGER